MVESWYIGPAANQPSGKKTGCSPIKVHRYLIVGHIESAACYSATVEGCRHCRKLTCGHLNGATFRQGGDYRYCSCQQLMIEAAAGCMDLRVTNPADEITDIDPRL